MKAVMPLGVHHSGKTHFVALLTLHYENLEIQNKFLDVNIETHLFNKDVNQRLQIRENIDDLRKGIGLLSTRISKAQAGAIIVKYDVPFWKDKKHKIKCYDLAGELFDPVMGVVMKNKLNSVEECITHYRNTSSNASLIEDDELEEIYNAVFTSDVYFVIINLRQIMDVMDDVQGKMFESIRVFNEHHVRMLENIAVNSPNKKIAIVCTNYYQTKDIFKLKHGMDEPDDVRSLLAGLYINNIVNTIKDCFHEPEIFLTGTQLNGRYRMTVDNFPSPYYTELEFDRIITWLEDVL